MDLSLILKKYYGDCEGPLGFRQTSAAAKATEAALKDQPSDVRTAIKCSIDDQDVEGYMRKSIVPFSKSDVDEKERTDKSLITTESVDRDGDVIIAAGLNFDPFKDNPQVTWGHNYHELPVGRCLWVNREKHSNPRKNGWMARTLYHKKPEAWGDAPYFAEAVWDLVKQRALPGKSIGFLPKKIREITENDVKARPELAQIAKRGWIVEKAVVFEYAVALIPVNPDALAVSIEKAITSKVPHIKSLADSMGMIIPSTHDDNLEDLLLETKAAEELPKTGINILDRRSKPKGLKILSRFNEVDTVVDTVDMMKAAAEAATKRTLMRLQGRVV